MAAMIASSACGVEVTLVLVLVLVLCWCWCWCWSWSWSRELELELEQASDGCRAGTACHGTNAYSRFQARRRLYPRICRLPIGIVRIPRSHVHDIADGRFALVPDAHLRSRSRRKVRRKRDAEFGVIDHVAVIGTRIRVRRPTEYRRGDAAEMLDSQGRSRRLHACGSRRWPADAHAIALREVRDLDLMALITATAYVGVALRLLIEGHVMVTATKIEDEHVAGLRRVDGVRIVAMPPQTGIYRRRSARIPASRR